jgi:hypothetical protein
VKGIRPKLRQSFTAYASDYSPHVCFDLTGPQAATFDPAAVARFFETRIVAH